LLIGLRYKIIARISQFEGPDEDIAHAAANVLQWNIWIPYDKIKVKVENGWITLSGEVDRWYQKDTAGDAVRNLIGVRGLSNNIIINATAKALDVKDGIERAFERNALLDARRITVETSGGKVILRGSVRNWAEREQVQWAAWAAPGVVLAAAYLLWLYQRVFFGTVTNPKNEKLHDLTPREVLTFVPLIIMAFWIGLYPKPFFQILEQPVNQIVQTIHDANANAPVNAQVVPAAAPQAPAAVVPKAVRPSVVKSNIVKPKASN